MERSPRRVFCAPCSAVVCQGRTTMEVQRMECVSQKMSHPTPLYHPLRGHSGTSYHLSVIETCIRYAWLLTLMRHLYIHHLRYETICLQEMVDGQVNTSHSIISVGFKQQNEFSSATFFT